MNAKVFLVLILKENHKTGPLCLLELLGSTFNLAKFHPKKERWHVSFLPGSLVKLVIITKPY